ncbi:MAG: hypothetical protein KYX67_08900 [Brevundimonas sp.]|uniref:Uncharacterized protein n=1 Tax=Brevundimonas mediterranea TaxID=74329 RepID=A0A7W6AB12_9CAUL|nr:MULTISPECIES: hypothetical protein [Brevundimonas]MBB3873653.1 hypothetical protein [Brevundimonas mediterranea]MDK2747424.1 hypothetical protein [Brevundimonas sp.]
MNKTETPDGMEEGPAPLWALWRRLKALFPIWSLIPSSFYTPGAWGYAGVDFISGFRRNPSTLKTFALLEGADAAEFEALSALANLNARRQDQMFRFVVVCYLTIPLSILALLAELAGDGLLSFTRDHMSLVASTFVLMGLGPLAYLMSQWRSRQIIGVLDLIRIERGRATDRRDD